MFSLPDLPYPYGALAPVISERAMRLHHDKHHAAYVETTNKLLGAACGGSLEAVIRDARPKGDAKLFDNAAQAWNHAFFWVAMTDRRRPPSASLAEAIAKAFGSLGALGEAFVEAGVGHFGSGWVWLIAQTDGRLAVRTTHDADDTLTGGRAVTPLLVCDLWEHAYYLDHQNDRRGFLEAWFQAAPDWSFAERQLAAARGEGDAWRYPAPGESSQRRRAS